MGLKDDISLPADSPGGPVTRFWGGGGHAQHHAQSDHGSGPLLLPSHLYWSLRGKGTLGEPGAVWVMGQQVEPGLCTENRGSPRIG